MTEYARIEDNRVIEYPLTEEAIRARFPNVSFGSTLPENYVIVQPRQKPQYNTIIQALGVVPKQEGDEWVQDWVVRDRFRDIEVDASGRRVTSRTLPTSEITTLTKEQQENDALSKDARQTRDALLKETDWMVLPGSPLTAVELTTIQTYRQALRDITSQEGFPRTIEWPVKP